MNQLQVFSNDEFGDISTKQVNGETYFLAKDVARVLGIKDRTTAVRRLSENQRLIRTVCAAGQNRDVLFVNESGLYKLVFTSRKPEAEKFTEWVTSEVLPSIRKTGKYEVKKNPALVMAEALIVAQQTIDGQLLKLEEMKPKAEFFDAVANTRDLVDIGEVSKILAIKDLGRNNLYRLLRETGILMKDREPKQQYVNQGYFRIIEQHFTIKGKNKVNLKTMVTQRGLDFIRRHIEKVGM